MSVALAPVLIVLAVVVVLGAALAVLARRRRIPERDRGRVREVLRTAPLNTQGDPRPTGSVRFMGEQGGRGALPA